ncbi:MAG: ABC transporter ATP-binding protein [Planctomycetota bacterium]
MTHNHVASARGQSLGYAVTDEALPGAAMVAMHDLTRLYGVVIGVNHITLDIPHGVRGLLGPNGAGKSTLLKLICGQIRPSEGSIRVLGEAPWNHPGLFRRVGVCPEQDAFWSFMTGLEFVTTLARLSGLDPHAATRAAEEALDRCGCTPFMNRKINGYSKGMRQRTKVAQAIVHKPDLVVLDEPLNGTDPVGRRDMLDLIVQLGREGRSVLISSHVLHEVQSVTEEFTLIYNGRVLASGNVGEIRSLLDRFPHHIRVKCADARRLGWQLMRDLPVTGVDVAADNRSLSVQTLDPGRFYREFPAVVLDSGQAVEEMTSQDDNLDAVFRYLVDER